ncbi:hypothetical protein [Sporosarcina koreensis]|uniref:Uncharacterized protein n=1 Tax=Sporosarcina koreensis TaxID=334735 RepID=A0ABW0TW89_9BACL
MDDSKINMDKAVENNIAWCELVCAAYGKRSYTTERVWGLHTTAPTYYPELITTKRSTTETDIIEFLKLDHVGSIKDSYATLQLEPYGYQMLFEAEWIWHPALIEQESKRSQWNIVRTEKEFERWTKMTGLENSIPSGLLDIEGVKIFYTDRPNGFAGFIASAAADVIGISNVFSSGGDEIDLWRAIPQVAAREFPGLPLVGYEQGDSLSSALSSGWTSIGPLRVWIKTS